jgi:DNA polymerase elongation subunit (family B)
MEPKTLIFDIEVSPDIIASYGLREQYHSHKNILQDWYMICFAWKWLGGKNILSSSILDDLAAFRKNPSDDLVVVKRLHEVLQDADVIVGHNCDRFDWKKFQTRAAFHGLKPISKPAVVDTLKTAKKHFAFTSNSMAYISKYLGTEEKKTHSPDMWMKILRGDKSAIKECVDYCKGDIQATEDLYLKLRPYMDDHPNHNLFRNKDIECCPKCGSLEFTSNGSTLRATGRYKKYICSKCLGHFRDTRTIARAAVK